MAIIKLLIVIISSAWRNTNVHHFVDNFAAADKCSAAVAMESLEIIVFIMQQILDNYQS